MVSLDEVPHVTAKTFIFFSIEAALQLYDGRIAKNPEGIIILS